MQNQRGNFLLQALLALTLAFVFMPFFASKLSVRDMNAKMHSVTQQVEYVYEAATNYLRENKNDLNYGETNYDDDILVKVLRPYGLPLGFRNETIFGQTMSLNIVKKEDFIGAEIKISGGELSNIQVAELIRRINLFARDEGDGNISVFVPVDSSVTSYTDIVLKEEPEDGIFLSALKMGLEDEDGNVLERHNIDGLGGLGSEFTDDDVNNVTNGAQTGSFDTGEFRKITLFGKEGSTFKNNIDSFNVTGSTDIYGFLKIGGADLNIGSNMTVNYISASSGNADIPGDYLFASEKFLASLNTHRLKTNDFMVIGNSDNFTLPSKWTQIGQNLSAPNYKLNARPDDGSGVVDVHTDVFAVEDKGTIDAASNTGGGIEVDDLIAENIIVGESGIEDLKDGVQSNIIFKISPAGESLFEDVYVEIFNGNQINNGKIYIIQDPGKQNSTLKSCEQIFDEKDYIKYNKYSLAQHIICQYLFWERLEHRINIRDHTWPID